MCTSCLQSNKCLIILRHFTRKTYDITNPNTNILVSATAAEVGNQRKFGRYFRVTKSRDVMSIRKHEIKEISCLLESEINEISCQLESEINEMSCQWVV